jgi:hypothetical protein
VDKAQEWVFDLQPIITIQNRLTQKTRELIEAKIKEDVHKSQCMKVDSIIWSDCLKVRVIPAIGSSKQVIDLIKANLKETIEKKFTSKKLQSKPTITELYNYREIDKNKDIFVYKNDGVHMVGFDVETEIHRINSIIQSKKVESNISIHNALI